MAEQKAAGKRKSTMKKVWYYERKKFANRKFWREN